MKATQLLSEMCLQAQPECLSSVRCCVRDAARRAGCDDAMTDNMVLAINEACMNVIQHGYQFLPNQEFQLRVLLEQDNLVFELLDHAQPVQVASVKSRALEDVRPGGLGVHFICSIMDEMTFVAPPAGFGNLLRMVKRIKLGDADGT